MSHLSNHLFEYISGAKCQIWAGNRCITDIRTLNVTDNDKPEILDLCGTPTTGDDYLFSFSIKDNIRLSVANLLYWFDDGDANEIQMIKEKEYVITVPNDAIDLFAKVTAIDDANNEQVLWIVKPVIDNDAPIITDQTLGYPDTGGEFYIKFKVVENRILKNVFVEYGFDNFNNSTAVIDLQQDSYSLDMYIPENSQVLYYSIIVEDANNNTARITNSKFVLDIIPPVIKDLTNSTPTTGDQFEINAEIDDNIGIREVQLEYWFDNYTWTQLSFFGYQIIKVPSDANILYYNIIAQDINFNNRFLRKEIKVVDNDKPVIMDQSYSIKHYYLFSVKVLDNIEVSYVRVDYRFNNESPRAFLLNILNNNYERKIPLIITETCGKLFYTISAVDTSNNLAHTQEIEIDLPKTETEHSKPSTTSEEMEFLGFYLIIIFILIFIVVFIVLYLKKHRKKSTTAPSAQPPAILKTTSTDDVVTDSNKVNKKS